MAKKFMCVCFGILALAIAFHLGAQYGSASIVDHSTTGIVAANYAQGYYVLLDDGQVYELSQSQSWNRLGLWDLPIPVSQVKFWLGPLCFISTANEAWFRGSYNDEWVNYGSPPGAAMTQPTTWSKIKAEFGE